MFHTIKDEQPVSKMEGKNNFPRRLKQFDGLTWLAMTPIFYDRSTPLIQAVVRCQSRTHRRAVGTSRTQTNWHGRRSHHSGVGRAHLWRWFCDHRLRRGDLPKRKYDGLDDRCARRRHASVDRADWSVRAGPVLRQSVLREPGRHVQEAVRTGRADICQETTS